MKNFIYILIIIFSLNSCSEYQRVLKNGVQAGDDNHEAIVLGNI